jgi:cation transport ATPase
MDCPGCHGGLEKLVNRVPGVLESRANWEEKRLQVRLRQGTDLKDEDIFEAIKRANFTPGKRLN